MAICWEADAIRDQQGRLVYLVEEILETQMRKTKKFFRELWEAAWEAVELYRNEISPNIPMWRRLLFWIPMILFLAIASNVSR